MSRITRYVVGELLKTFLLTSLVMTSLLVLVFLVQEAWRENLTPETILQLIPFTLPTALCFAIPGTILFAACIVYGRMSASNEIVAIKAMGIPPTKVVFPGLVLAVVLSLVTVYLNDLSVSWGKHGIYRVVLESSAKTIYSVLRAEGDFKKGKVSIHADEIRGDVLVGAHIEEAAENASERLRVFARYARIHVNPEENTLVFLIKDGQVNFGNEGTAYIDEKDFPVPLGSVTRKSDTAQSPSNIPLRRISAEYARQRQQNIGDRRDLALDATLQLLGGNFVAVTHPRWKQQQKRLEDGVYRSHRLKTEPWRRWANGFSCFCFVLVGAGVAIQFGRFDFWSIFGICFIPILLLYYPLLMYGVGEAKSGHLPPYAVWIGNGVILAIGLLLLRRIERN